MMFRKILTFSFLIFALFGCETIEDNSPALQGEVEGVFYKATNARATENEDGSFLIQGVSQNESLSLFVPAGNPNNYILDENSAAFATFNNSMGNLYTTRPEGNGRITITNWDQTQQTLSGTFAFNAVLTDLDTLNVQKGVFFEVPYGNGIVVEDEEEEPQAGTFVMTVDGTTFNPLSITASQAGNIITITGASPSRTVTLTLPVDITNGNFDIPMGAINGRYQAGDIDETAESGNLTIFSHNPENRTIQGTFSFWTASTAIAQGQFDVVYQ